MERGLVVRITLAVRGIALTDPKRPSLKDEAEQLEKVLNS